MFKNKEIEADLRNLSKPAFGKIEEFILTKLKGRLRLEAVNQGILGMLIWLMIRL
jgi:hypothetical protein